MEMILRMVMRLLSQMTAPVIGESRHVPLFALSLSLSLPLLAALLARFSRSTRTGLSRARLFLPLLRGLLDRL